MGNAESMHIKYQVLIYYNHIQQRRIVNKMFLKPRIVGKANITKSQNHKKNPSLVCLSDR